MPTPAITRLAQAARRRLWLVGLAVAALPGSAGAAAATAPATYVGSERCAGCHEAAYQAWRDSHHDLAMQAPTPQTVLGDFRDARFEHFGVLTEFFRRGDAYMVRTEGPDGQRTEYQVAWVFGVYPLQQYLLPLEGGRLQALSVAWDSRPHSEGGQRWYHLYPDEAIGPDDPLHWSGPYHNWNTRCAECHSTDLRKNYDAATRRFATRFAEEHVGCEACHGPGSRHLALARSGRLQAGAQPAGAAGFAVDLKARGVWVFPEGEAIARRSTRLDNNLQIDTCARCHARRGALGAYRHGRPLSDTHRLTLLGDPLYHPDGQILDEVYVYGSFVQSKMHRAGVVCSNCHDPHSNRLRAPGNGVCAQCHQPSTYDTRAHHRHPAASAGARCVNCHMPASTYMGVDARRDHAMRSPRPDLSVMLATPNACNGCHTQQNAQWALDTLRRWGVTLRHTAGHPAVALNALARGDTRDAATLVALAADPAAASIWRATALERTAAAGAARALELAAELLKSRSPLLRISAVRSLRALPIQRRYRVLAPLLSDPVSGVRLAVAMSLAGTPLERIRDAERQALLALFDEYRAVHREHADMPSMNLQLGLFNLARGDLPGAEMAYREALAIDPQWLPARLNLADMLRAAGREDDARAELTRALEAHPQSADALHALGLLEAREGNPQQALRWLGRAAGLSAASAHHRFVFAVARHDFGDLNGALLTLRALHADRPADAAALLALVNYSVEAGAKNAARGYAQKLLRLDPGNAQYRRLAAGLR